MSVLISIEDDDHVAARHNSGEELWSFEVGVNQLPPDDVGDDRR